jgi:hypothetical protein
MIASPGSSCQSRAPTSLPEAGVACLHTSHLPRPRRQKIHAPISIVIQLNKQTLHTFQDAYIILSYIMKSIIVHISEKTKEK